MDETNRNGNQRIKELERLLMLERQKYRIISGMVKCGLWEYNVATGELCQSRRADGAKTAEGLRIPHFRKTMRECGLIVPADLPVFDALCDSMDNGDEAFSYEFRAFVDADNNETWLRYEGYAMFDANGNPVKVIGRTLNVDEEKRAEQVVIKEAEKDSLTGLPSLAAFQEHFEITAKRCRENDRFAFFILDVDDFSSITDTWGNAYGKYVLEKLAHGLDAVFGEPDYVSHTTDDEFVAIRVGVKGPADVFSLSRAIAKMASRIDLKRDNRLKISMGVAIFPLDGRDYGSLYEKAKIALEATKHNPNADCSIYEESMNKNRRYRVNKEKKAVAKTEAQRIVSEHRNIQYGPVEKYIINRTFEMLATDGGGGDVEKIFAEIGKYYHYRRIYVVQKDEQRQNVRLRYFWDAEPNPYVGTFETVMRDNIASIRQRFANDSTFIATNTAQLGLRIPNGAQAYFGNASILQYVIIDNDDTFSFITFEKEENGGWAKEEQEVLTGMARLLGIFIERVRSRELLAEEISYTHAIIENQQITNYAVIPGSYELVYVGDYTGRQYPAAHSGEVCYRAIMGRKKPCANCPIAGLSEEHPVNTTESYYEEQKRWISTTASYVEDAGSLQCLVCWSDVTEFVERVRSRDVLTGQLTVERFEEEANRITSENPRGNRCFVYYNFPQFGDLNDVWGYQVCNEIMKIFSTSLAAYLTEGELSARIRGANFVLMLDYDDKERTEARIEMILQAAHTAVTRLYPDLRLNVWCGIYRFQAKEDSVAEAMERANRARKSIGSMNDPATIAIAFYSDDLRKSNSFRDFVENSMRDALSNHEFKVFFQPKRDMETGKIVGAEALVRWITGEGQVLEPCSFLPIFEENGFISEMDYYVHKETFRLIREWLDSGVRPPIISLGSSWQYMFSADFINRTKYLLQRYHIPAELIEMVIPDGVSATSFNTIMSILQELQNIGFVVEIDAYLAKCAMSTLPKDLPMSVVKKNPDYAKLLKAMEQRRLSAPMPPEDFQSLLKLRGYR